MDVNVIPFGDNEMERETERVASVAVAVGRSRVCGAAINIPGVLLSQSSAYSFH